jgi:hypothetical protein
MNCICGHNLGQHPPDSQRPFSWPCRACNCTHYREVKSIWPVYILDNFDGLPIMRIVRLHRLNNGRFLVVEGTVPR